MASAGALAGEDPKQQARFIVGFQEMPDVEPGDTYDGFEVVEVVPDLTFAVVEASGQDALQAELLDDDNVRYIEQDHDQWRPSFTPNDPKYPDQYGPQITQTQGAWDVTLGSTSVKLGLLDTGINPDHEDFVADRISGYDYVNDDSTPEDAGNCGYHGSHTSGTAAATTDNGAGIAGMSESSIIMHKIFDNGGFFGCGAASTSDIAQALKDLGDKGAHISSNSWGGSSNSSTLNDAIDYAHDKGVIHVAAAGNDGSCTDCIGEPWSSRPGKVIVVTCSTSDDTFCDFSSQGPEADIIAPGNNVLSVDGGDNDGYTEKSGTSMSTPHVAGAVGLYIDANGDVGHSTMESELGSSADDLGLSAERQGDGRLNSSGLLGTSTDTNSAPTAEFTHSCTDLNCTFDGSNSTDSDGNITSYDWEFGDGNTGSGETVDHTYAESGNYTVNLTVTDDDGATDTSSQTISVGNTSGGDDGGSNDTMHVHAIDHRATGPHANVDVTIYDSNEDPVSDVTVDAETCDSDNNCQTWTATTGSDGVVSFKWQHAGSGTYTTCVQDLTHDTLSWDTNDDHADDGNCETETI